MKFIPTRLHAVADYLVGIFVGALPYLLGVGGTPRVALLALGSLVIIYSLMTDYEFGAFRVLRVRLHLFLDVLFGVAMLSLPIVFFMPGVAPWPFYLIGALAIFLSLTTEIRAAGSAA